MEMSRSRQVLCSRPDTLKQNEWNGVPVILARAVELPRGALVEFQVNMHSGRQGHAAQESMQSGANEMDGDDDDDDEVDESSLTGVYSDGEAGGVYWQKCAAPKTRAGWRAAVFLPGKHTRRW